VRRNNAKEERWQRTTAKRQRQRTTAKGHDRWRRQMLAGYLCYASELGSGGAADGGMSLATKCEEVRSKTTEFLQGEICSIYT
jgi:hypothetical protein